LAFFFGITFLTAFVAFLAADLAAFFTERAIFLILDLLAMGFLYRLDFLADFFLVVFLADFFAAFLPALFLEPDFLEGFFAFLLFAALDAAADFLAFFTTLETAFAGADFAAAFLKRLTTAFAAEFARMVAELTTRSPTISPISGLGWPVCSPGFFSVSMTTLRYLK
jgi:hypothetical protein